METKKSRVTNVSKVKSLVERGHKVLDVSINRYGYLSFEFERTEQFLKDFGEIQEQYKKIRKTK